MDRLDELAIFMPRRAGAPGWRKEGGNGCGENPRA
jgi:hypothetical protein